jgi:C4-dicarboxylate-specific signal transduction histidine kinase
MAALGEMAASIAHEINNPLSIVSGLAHKLKTLATDSKMSPEAANEIAERLEATVARISRIVKSMRSFARDSGGDEMALTSVADLLQETLGLCSEKFKAHGVALKVGTVPKEALLLCRPTQIGEVLLNLLNNSYDAVVALPDPWISVVVEVDQRFIRFIITDAGSGIPEDIRDKILLPFFTTKEVGKGTGLGLSISKGITEAHGGCLCLDPSAKNTCFIVELPLKK